jgi:hypothetical protein
MGKQQLIASGPAVKIEVRRSGWYRITPAQLSAAGLDLSVNARMLQMFVDGEEIPISLTGDGMHLNGNDALEFYGVALDTPTADGHIYWLVVGDVPGKRIVNKRQRFKPSDQEWTESASGGSFSSTVQLKEHLLYFPSLLNGDTENIFGQLVVTEPTNQILTVRSVDRESPTQLAQLEVALQGASLVAHRVQVKLNGNDIGTVEYNNREHSVSTFSINATLLNEGENTISVAALNGQSDLSLIDYIRIAYARHYRADGNVLQFSVPAGETVRVTGFGSPDIRVLDITDPNAVGEVNAAIGPLGSGYSAKLQTRNFGTRTFFAFTEDQVAQPVSITANQPSNWSAGSNTADLVVVTHKDFRQAIEPLIAQRRAEGLDVSVVDIEDVLDEFGYGTHSPQALRQFLSWTSTQWATAPQYVLLVGDSSFDPRDYLGQGANDFVPTKLVDTSFMETASDDWLADFNGDGIEDLGIGRLPGRTAAEISLMVNKLLIYEQERQTGLPPRDALMVADAGFEELSSQTSTLLPPTMTVETINRAAIGNDEMVRMQIVESINDGPAIVNYYGHGSVQVWTGAGILDSTVANTLTNGNRLALFLMMTCLNGYSHDVYIDSLGESVLKAPNGGAVSVWASTGFTEPQPQFDLDAEFYRQLFGATELRLGQAIRNAKAATSDMDVRRTWILLGDPTMRIR